MKYYIKYRKIGKDRGKFMTEEKKTSNQNRKANPEHRTQKTVEQGRQGKKKPVHKKKEDMTKGERVKAFLKSKLLSIILSGRQFVITIIFLSLLLYLNLLPIKYFLPLTLILLLFVAYTFLTAQSKKFRTFGKIISIVFTALWSVGIYYVGYLNGMFGAVSGADTKTDVINIYVMKDDTAKSIEDAKDYTFGILTNIERENTDKTLASVKDKVGKEVAKKEYESWPEMIEALYNGDIGAVILKSAFIDTIVETEGFETFADDTRVLYENSIVTQIKTDTDKDLTNNVFILYISGIDVFGSISTTSRSDVNIIAVINPDTRQVLLVNTPRDYYVPLAMNGSPLDKLTHAGIYGIDMSMNTLGNLYGIDMDHYFRINFSGFTDVIDALGGIEVNSEYAFTTHYGNYYIKKGINYLNGDQALGFARERYSLPGGDNQRGKDQMAVITAIINKMSSSSLLNDFSGLMDSLEGSFETSMSSSQISSLVRMQLNEGGSWNVVSYAVTGTGSSKETYSMPGRNVYVMDPDYSTVDKAKELIKKVYNGDTLSDADIQ